MTQDKDTEMNEHTMKTDTEWKLSPNEKACI